MTKIEVTKITIIQTGGTDDVIMDTTLPCAVWPFTGTAHVKMQTACGTAEKYVKENFPGVPYNIIKAR